MSKKLLFGGVFATHTEWDENGNVTQRDEFHTRLYWDLWNSGAMLNLKGARLHVLLTIVQHADKKGEGFPSIRRMTELLPYNKNAINEAIKDLIELGFLERSQERKEGGRFAHNTYTIKPVLPCPENKDTVKSEENQEVLPCPENTDAVKTGNRKQGHKKESLLKKDFDDDTTVGSPNEWEKDFQYMAFRQQFTNAGGSDIRKHNEHYSKYLEVKNNVGFGKLCELADEYIKAVQTGEHPHKSRGVQILWFLNDGWQNFGRAPEKKNSPKKNQPKRSIAEELNIVGLGGVPEWKL